MTDRSVLWVNHYAVPPDHGGGTRHFEISRELRDFGWSPTIAASDFNHQTRRYSRRDGPQDRTHHREVIDGVAFQWLWAAPYERNDWRRGWNWLSFARSLLQYEEEKARWDVVIGSSPHLFAAGAAARLARRNSTPFVLEVRDLWPESMVAAGGRKGALYHALGWLARWLYARADVIVVLAEGSRDHLVRSGVSAEKIHFVPNGVQIESFPPRKVREDSQELTFVYAGAHGAANGLDVVLEAADLLRERSDIRFLLVGDGPKKPDLIAHAQSLALENVEFRDPVPKSEIPSLLAEADVGLMVLRDSPLFAYGVSPNKLFDYMAASLPVVSNVPGDVANVVTEAGAGEVADPGSPESLAEAIHRLADRSAEVRHAMGVRGHEWVARERSRQRLAERLDVALRSAGVS